MEPTTEQLLYNTIRDAYELLRYEGLSTRSAKARSLLLETLELYEKERGIEHARD